MVLKDVFFFLEGCVGSNRFIPPLVPPCHQSHLLKLLNILFYIWGSMRPKFVALQSESEA